MELKHHKRSNTRTEEKVEEESEAKPDEKLKHDIDDILDEIDEVLEENAEKMIREYVQKGGQASDTEGWRILGSFRSWLRKVRNVEVTIQRLGTIISTVITNIPMSGKPVRPVGLRVGSKLVGGFAHMPVLKQMI